MVNEFQLEKEVGPRWKEWNSGELVNNVFLGGQRNKRAAATFPFFSAGSRRAQDVNGEGPIKINLNLPVSSSVTVAASSQKSGSEIESYNKNSTTAISMMSTGVGAGGAGGGQQVPTTRDTLVVLITLTIILITLVVSYYFWKKNKSRRRSSYLSGGGGGGGAGNNSSHSVYMYSRLSQNDVEVDNISFQGDLTHKALVNQSGGHGVPVVPSCGVDDDDDDQVRPATLCLEYDSLVTISNDQHEENHNENGGTGRNKNPSFNNRHRLSSSSDVVVDDAPVNLLMDDLSDEDLLQ